MIKLLLPDAAQVRCENVKVLKDNGLLLELVSNSDHSVCPLCRKKTTRIHSRYSRHMADLPWADVAVSIDLQVRRFFCLNDDCPRVIFCERLPGVVAP